MTIYIRQGHFADNYQAIEVDDPFKWLADKIKTAPEVDEKTRAEYMISGKMQPQSDGTYYRNDENLLVRDLIMIDYDFDNEPQDNFSINHADFKAEIASKLQDAKYLLYPTFRADNDRVRYRLVVKPNMPMDRDTYKVMATQLVRHINLPTDKSAVNTWSQPQGAPVKSKNNAVLSPVIKNDGNTLKVHSKAVIDTKLNEIERFIEKSPLLNKNIPTEVENKQMISSNDIKIDKKLALDIINDYIAAEAPKGNLQDYNNSLSAILVLAKSVQNDVIDTDTAIECVRMLAMGNSKWETDNIKKLKHGIQTTIRNEYDFISKFIIAAGIKDKYPQIVQEDTANKEVIDIRSKINELDLSKLTINDIPKEWLQHFTDDELAELHQNTSPCRQLDRFFADIKSKSKIPPVSTGFADLDAILDGGLYTGLYFIGAISSLGKTTFLLQIADQVAKQGRDVLIFSLEMSRYQIMSKTLSRLTYEISDSEERASYYISDGRGHKVWNARTSRQITDYRRYDGYTDTKGRYHEPYTEYQKELIDRAAKEYRSFGDHIYIHEGVGDIGVNEIREAVDIHTNATGTAPIVILDYLQILTPANDRSSDKQNTDRAVVELKRISRDYDIPVMAISSLNRENYSKGISMLAFKESGAIEYSSDVLIGLQFAAQREADISNKNVSEKSKDYVRINVDDEKRKEPREIELKILKQRDGQATGSVDFYYYTRFNYYEETDELDGSNHNYYENKTNGNLTDRIKDQTPFEFNEEDVGNGVFKITPKLK